MLGCFFRAETLPDALFILKKIAKVNFTEKLNPILNQTELYFSFILIGIILAKEYFIYNISTKNTVKFWLIFIGMVFINYIFGVFQAKQFIYFQF